MRNTSSGISLLQIFSELKNKKHQIYVTSRFVYYDKGVVFPHSAAFRPKNEVLLTLFIIKLLEVLKNSEGIEESNNNIVINNDKY